MKLQLNMNTFGPHQIAIFLYPMFALYALTFINKYIHISNRIISRIIRRIIHLPSIDLQMFKTT